MRLKELREQQRLSQKQIAAALGVDQSAVSYWESGKTNPRVTTLMQLANILGCTVDELLEDEPKS